jgi:hypothetical protein
MSRIRLVALQKETLLFMADVRSIGAKSYNMSGILSTCSDFNRKDLILVDRYFSFFVI